MESTASPSPEKVAEQVLGTLRAQSNAENVAGMARYGISATQNLGVSMPIIKQLARESRRALGRDPVAWHELAAVLWDAGWRDTRLCAVFADDPSLVTPEQMDAWAADFDSWDICDGTCTHLFDRTPLAWEKARVWAGRRDEFVKRGGFVIVAGLAVHDKSAPNDAFTAFLPIIEREATDERNFVKKGVNWALRHIGKRNVALNGAAIACAERIVTANTGSKAALWIARDALRELQSDAVKQRLGLI